MTWGNTIGLALIAGFVMYIAINGDLPSYLGLFTSASASGSTAQPAAATGTTGGAAPVGTSSVSTIGGLAGFGSALLGPGTAALGALGL